MRSADRLPDIHSAYSRFKKKSGQGLLWSLVALLAFVLVGLKSYSTIYVWVTAIDVQVIGPEDPICVAVPEWAGIAGGVIANRGLQPSNDSLFWDEHGLEVEFKIVEDYEERLRLFNAGECDLMLDTIEQFAGNYGQRRFEKSDPSVIFLMDFSTGGDGVGATRDIDYIGRPLIAKKIVAEKLSPPYYLFITLLNRSDLLKEEIEAIKGGIVEVDSASQAAEVFAKGDADVFISWEPNLSEALKKRDGHKIVTTAQAPELIADIMLARGDFLKENPRKAESFVAGWFEGVADFYNNWEMSIDLIEDVLPGAGETLRDDIRIVGLAENLDIFKKRSGGATRFERMFSRAAEFWLIDGARIDPIYAKSVVDPSVLEVVKQEAGSIEGSVYDIDEPIGREVAASRPKAEPFFKTSINLRFPTNVTDLSDGAKMTLDRFRDDVLDVFSNCTVLVIGHTDSEGTVEHNEYLSRVRAENVTKRLQSVEGGGCEMKFEGKGESELLVWDDDSEEKRMENRRIEILLLK